MVTTIGLSSDFHEVLQSLISLDFDAVEAYESAIERLENPQFKAKLTEFREDHLRHIRELSDYARAIHIEPPLGPDIKSALTTGKVVLADLFGNDKSILTAMKTNEDDTNTAYERALNHKHLEAEARDMISRALADERRHRAWIEETLDLLKHKAA